MIEIVDAGPGATVQDLGRPGLMHWAIGRSGAADRSSLRLANRLVGNDLDAAGVEITFGGLTFTTSRPAMVALTGATGPLLTAAPRAGFATPFVVRPGESVTVGRPSHGLRTYLAVRGGIAVDAVLGSRSTDTLGGLGPPALVRGTHLPIGAAQTGTPNVLPTEVAPVRRHDGVLSLRVVPGPRDEWTDLEALFAAAFTVRSDSDRIGTRLDGPRLPRRPGELPSEPTIRGAVQLPPDGRAIILGPDHPVTGGYPVVAVVVDRDLDALAQARPGSSVRLRPQNRIPSWP